MAGSESAKTAIEQALVSEVVDNVDYGRSFGRIFNKADDGSFSRTFSRGNPKLADISAQDLATMDDAAFKKFAQRLQELEGILNVNPLAGLSESSDRD